MLIWLAPFLNVNGDSKSIGAPVNCVQVPLISSFTSKV